ncbi:MAG: sodium/proton-translocating pyrophosphatase, partial [Acidimicrobiales bacterium]|nr:sodium/proton-translocating pyrophosphatase [Acidimicrobiales bacterium]
GDCAGMASDLFESSGVVLVASIILGVSAMSAIGVGPEDAAKGLVFPVAVMAFGLIASIIGIFLVKPKPGETDALKAIDRGIGIAQIIAVIGAAALAFGYVGNPDAVGGGDLLVSNPGARMFGAVLVGVALGFAASKITAYFTSTTTKPVQDIAKATRTGPATTVLEGISLGLESAVWGLIAVAAAIGGAIALGGGSFKFSV